ncbi:hypothetical protein CEF21_06395 [Bacillus sp. FJAT-42376]|uniref:hypothetical protein n=1 Tax=Bacillus sp. FJAT-42376 TaxID=2014076 RepID=UPI000F4F5386|nr:hypothetical protein [Bacillus sp. FJAT-42376]AZB41951.1 hypothetical protein CEF21_06395 [Bacillus sp. FJAT-42376]
MKSPYILSTALILSIAAGCSQSDSQSKPADQNSTAKASESANGAADVPESSSGVAKGEPAPGTTPGSNELTPEQVISETAAQLKSRVPFTLPKTIPVADDLHLTSMTKSDSKSYEITFYETKEPIPINSSKLKGLGNDSKIAVVKATEYKTEQEAADMVGYQKADPTGNPPVNLGSGIKGYTDAGAGSVFLNWNEGRWLFASKAMSAKGNQNIELGKKVVSYLESTMLPPPDKGRVTLDANAPEGRNHMIVWQDGNIVYQIEQPNGAMTGLDIAAAFHEK